MGTETQRLQEEIKSLLKQLNCSQKSFARMLIEQDSEDYSTEKEIQQAEERMKKHLTRASTPVDLLQTYLQQLQEHPDFSKLDIAIPNLQLLEEFDPQLIEAMRRVSRKLDEPPTDI
ncbi:MAG: hypothetical protein GAK43_01260 [Stenotrophomonas maltophilia]|nr:MAG: hypothetical protein GAK43_01260 [Stenotrophomonas maltophilia]